MMKLENILYAMWVHTIVLEGFVKHSAELHYEMIEKMERKGITTERVKELNDFMEEVYGEKMKHSGLSEKMINSLLENYADNLEKGLQYMDIAKGYGECGEMNLEMAEDSFEAEQEVMKFYDEMDGEK